MNTKYDNTALGHLERAEYWHNKRCDERDEDCNLCIALAGIRTALTACDSPHHTVECYVGAAPCVAITNADG